MKTDDLAINIDDIIMEAVEGEVVRINSQVLNNEIKTASSINTADSNSVTTENDSNTEKIKHEDLDEIKGDFPSENIKKVRFSQQIQSTVFFEIQKNSCNREKYGKLYTVYNRMKNIKAVRTFLNKCKRRQN